MSDIPENEIVVEVTDERLCDAVDDEGNCGAIENVKPDESMAEMDVQGGDFEETGDDFQKEDRLGEAPEDNGACECCEEAQSETEEDGLINTGVTERLILGAVFAEKTLKDYLEEAADEEKTAAGFVLDEFSENMDSKKLDQSQNGTDIESDYFFEDETACGSETAEETDTCSTAEETANEEINEPGQDGDDRELDIVANGMPAGVSDEGDSEISEIVGDIAEEEGYERRRTIGKGLGLTILLSFLILIGSVIYSYKTLVEHGSQLFRQHFDVVLKDFIGEESETVLKDATNAEFRFDVISEYNNEYPAGVVYDQVPKAGKTVKDNARVLLYVSEGIKMVDVPDVVGMSYGDAVRALREHDLSVVREPDKSGGAEQNTVTRVDPDIGTPIQAGSTVTIYVSMPYTSSNTVVPELTGMNTITAKAALSSCGLKLGNITQEWDYSLKPGTVISQSLKKGARVSIGTRVDIVTSLGYDIVSRSFKLDMPFKDKSGNTSYTVAFYDSEGKKVVSADKINCTGYTLYREGSINEVLTVKVGGSVFRKYEFNYQSGGYIIIEDHSGEFEMSVPSFYVSVSHNDGGFAICQSPVQWGRNCTVSITVIPGYEIDYVTDNGRNVTSSVSGGKYVINGIKDNHDVYIAFKWVGFSGDD